MEQRRRSQPLEITVNNRKHHENTPYHRPCGHHMRIVRMFAVRGGNRPAAAARRRTCRSGRSSRSPSRKPARRSTTSATSSGNRATAFRCSAPGIPPERPMSPLRTTPAPAFSIRSKVRKPSPTRSAMPSIRADALTKGLSGDTFEIDHFGAGRINPTLGPRRRVRHRGAADGGRDQ